MTIDKPFRPIILKAAKNFEKRFPGWLVLYSEWGPHIQKILPLCCETETDATELKERSPVSDNRAS